MKVALIVVGILALLAVPLSILMFYGMSEIRQLVIREVDLQKVADGTYDGSYHKGRWTFDVQVVVQDHRIRSVKNVNARMKALQVWNDRAEQAFIQRQSVSIDVVSGATLNSRAMQKAVEVALSSPPQP
ncbi:MAG TPA: FMN-binding protein [Polyangiales bacterium]|nr:FMN-binding protein [Polyangiales bacterium]